MTKPLPNEPHAPRSQADREKARVRVARKWAYLISMTTYVPSEHTALEKPLLEMVDDLFAALAAEPLGLETAERVGAELVALNCADKSSLQCTVDVLAGPLLTDHDVRKPPPERVVRLFGALAGGFTEAVRRRTTDQQETMCRALIEVAKRAMYAAENRQTDFGDTSTELTLLRRQLSHQLLHDPLTGLPNRQFFGTRLEEVLNSGSPTALFRIELNGFEVFNEGLGGPHADALMTAIAVRLRSAMPGEGMMVARFDRAGFTVLQERDANGTSPAEVVTAINTAVTTTTHVADLGLTPTASIGVVQSPPHRADPVEFLQAADIALRYAKEEGPGRWRMLMPDEDAHDRRLLRLAATMPSALEDERLTIGYRLRVGLVDAQPAGVDGFVRWQEPGLADVVEQIGLSPRLGQWLLRNACWRMPDGNLPLSVRLTPNQSAAPDLVDTVLTALDEAELPAGRLELAMPAAEVFDGRARSVDNLASLAAAGVGTAMHGFGGDPSEVVRLGGLPVRAVALTARLVSQARGASRKSLLGLALTGLSAMVHDSGAVVAVDDVRSRREAEWWRHVGADTASGPLFSAGGDREDPEELFAE
ncbi:MAG: diguanylate cyclase [Actinophytocola sp.]|uniref:diguanylate cyclase domain-containing protein n=1 Tax=Actinophytocola sp. TaxID=1872138 RepID=UPI003C78E176